MRAGRSHLIGGSWCGDRRGCQQLQFCPEGLVVQAAGEDGVGAPKEQDGHDKEPAQRREPL